MCWQHWRGVLVQGHSEQSERSCLAHLAVIVTGSGMYLHPCFRPAHINEVNTPWGCRNQKDDTGETPGRCVNVLSQSKVMAMPLGFHPIRRGLAEKGPAQGSGTHLLLLVGSLGCRGDG
ncbi:hypothetical protein DPEC_G00026680 [Dallia pectoralis]|uniref:Uncharacterized protein n=1 Tax=Dallia pectoralis TaxID=75939 RepID=A0ACC2HIM2_DALPE|nr:hypothetical protein DPEC_G00026680 [Dallia pectoralis]